MGPQVRKIAPFGAEVQLDLRPGDSLGEEARDALRTRFTYTEQYPADSVGEDLHNANLLVDAE